MTYGEYNEKLKGYNLKIAREALYIGVGINDPKQLSQIIMVQEAIIRGEG